MTEFERMRRGEPYTFLDPEILASLRHARKACARLNACTSLSGEDYRKALTELIPGVPESVKISPPFRCEHGNGIRIGAGSFINYGCVVFDQAPVVIGRYVKIGPCCELLTVNHPLDWRERRKPVEKALPIVIGDDVWLGGGVIVCPGVRIGARSVIAAGSVVVRDIPSDVLAAGNPAVVKRRLAPRDDMSPSPAPGNKNNCGPDDE